MKCHHSSNSEKKRRNQNSILDNDTNVREVISTVVNCLSMSDELGKMASNCASWSDETFILGVVISRENQLPTITHIVPNSAANNAELKTGDIVVFINDRSVSGMSAEEITDLIAAFAGGALAQLTFGVRYQTMENQLRSCVIDRSHIPRENPYNQLIGFFKKHKSRNQTIRENLGKMVETHQIIDDLEEFYNYNQHRTP